MTQASQPGQMNVDVLPRDLAELQSVLQQLPAETWRSVEPLLSRVVDSTRRRRRILALVQEALSQLRLDLKYLMFDLEATRRERDEYRRQIVSIKLSSGRALKAYVYVMSQEGESLITLEPWDLEAFKREHLQQYLNQG